MRASAAEVEVGGAAVLAPASDAGAGASVVRLGADIAPLNALPGRALGTSPQISNAPDALPLPAPAAASAPASAPTASPVATIKTGLVARKINMAAAAATPQPEVDGIIARDGGVLRAENAAGDGRRIFDLAARRTLLSKGETLRDAVASPLPMAASRAVFFAPPAGAVAIGSVHLGVPSELSLQIGSGLVVKVREALAMTGAVEIKSPDIVAPIGTQARVLAASQASAAAIAAESAPVLVVAPISRPTPPARTPVNAWWSLVLLPAVFALLTLL